MYVCRLEGEKKVPGGEESARKDARRGASRFFPSHHRSATAFEGQSRGPPLRLFCAFKTGMLIILGSLRGTLNAHWSTEVFKT